jgi:hypothetical protein
MQVAARALVGRRHPDARRVARIDRGAEVVTPPLVARCGARRLAGVRPGHRRLQRDEEPRSGHGRARCLAGVRLRVDLEDVAGRVEADGAVAVVVPGFAHQLLRLEDGLRAGEVDPRAGDAVTRAALPRARVLHHGLVVRCFRLVHGVVHPPVEQPPPMFPPGTVGSSGAGKSVDLTSVSVSETSLPAGVPVMVAR